MQTGGDELEAVKSYFDTTGFERWNKIYGDTDEVNKVSSAMLAMPTIGRGWLERLSARPNGAWGTPCMHLRAA